MVSITVHLSINSNNFLRDLSNNQCNPTPFKKEREPLRKKLQLLRVIRIVPSKNRIMKINLKRKKI